MPDEFRSIFTKPTIAFVATLHPLKNPHLVLRMHAELRKQGIDHHLLMAGEGHLRSELEQFARQLGIDDTVFFTGFVDNPYPLIKASTALVLTSRLEGFALVLAEAMALGVPVVSCDSPCGPREVLHGGKYGLLVPEGQLDPLVEAMRSVLLDPTKRESMKHAGIAGTESHSIIPRAREMEALFQQVIETSGQHTSLSHLASTTASGNARA